MGPKLLLPMLDVVLICIWFNINVVQHSYFLYLSANGLWWELRGPYIASTIFNLVMNLVLGKLLGTTGIILASLLASLFFGLIWQCLVIFKCYFKTSPSGFYVRQIVYFAVSVLVAVISYYLCSLLPDGGIINLILKAFVTGASSAVILLLCYFKTSVFKRAVDFAKKTIKA